MSRTRWAAAAAALCGIFGAAAIGAGQIAGEAPLTKSAVFQWDELKPEPTRVGFVRRVIRTPTATLDELESHITTLNAGQSPHEPHQHPNEEMIILKEGAVEAFVNGEWVPVATGGMMFFASNVPHTVRNVSEHPATYYVVNWSTPGLKTGSESR
jgi:quercetin dioxygenase-like cupin family protein